jgi:predicted polyphosphate/ATP-dependent NAD kinase
LGAEPVAPVRAARALGRLATDAAGGIEIVAAPGAMGGDSARRAGFAVELVDEQAIPGATTALDTMRVAAALERRKVALIAFAGGDGTARDILSAVADRLPMLGIPAGVKMHSAVFAFSPEAAGLLIASMARNRDGVVRIREAEVMDVDEAAMRANRLSARLYGYARVPFERSLLQGPKSGAPPEDATLDALCHEVAQELQPNIIYVCGPGTTTGRVLRHLGLEGSLLGVDALRDCRLIGRDLSGHELAALVRGRETRILLGIVGGQGHVFGRGNQQIGPDVIRAVGRNNIMLLASQEKLLALDGRRLFADTGDPEVDAMLKGYIRVRIAPRRSTIMRIDTGD